jgi:hypothetical protein
MKVTGPQRQMLHNLMLDDEPAGDCWVHFDPPFAASTSTALIRLGLIDVNGDEGFRLTHDGRAFLSSGTMPNPYYTPAAWLAGREGLSDDPLRRAAQLALSALDQIIGADVLAVPEAVAAKVAYEALRAALG